MSSKPVLRLSPSAIRSFNACPYSYALGYVRRLPDHERRPITSLALGTMVHATIARFLRAGGWGRRGKDELMAMLSMGWKPSLFPDPESEGSAYQRARDLIDQFFDHPYPPDVERELGIEQSLVWSRPRRGILATGRVDRMCLRPGGRVEAIDYKTGHLPRDCERLDQDVQTIFYRSLVAESTRWLAPASTAVSFRYIGATTTVTINFDPIEFLDAWEEVLMTADRIRAARLAVAAGTPLAQAFPLHRGDQCAGCQFSNHCDRLRHPAAASDTKGKCR